MGRAVGCRAPPHPDAELDLVDASIEEKSFAEKVIESISAEVGTKRRKGSLRGEVSRAHDESEAKRLASAGLAAAGPPAAAAGLAGWGRWRDEKALAKRYRELAAAVNVWMSGLTP